MPASEARIRANQMNSLKSTGPSTTEGKSISRRNALKHGLTGGGVVLPDEDQAEVDRRFAALEAELAPKGELSAILVLRVATLSVRMERCVREEAARLGERMRHAAGEFDDRRLAEAQALLDWIAAEPATNARRLRRTPEGVDLMIKAWGALADDLAGPDLRRWGYGQWQRFENLRGRRPEDSPLSRDGALCKATWGEATYLEPGEAEGLDEPARREWARGLLSGRVAAELAALRALRDGFDLDAIERDRAGAAARAIFDDSKAATLARKYEAAAERGFYKALKELRQLEAEAEAAVVDPSGDDEAPPEESPEVALGSFFPGAIDDRPATPGQPEPRGKRGSKAPKRGRSRPT